jgi:hypothetical protein
MEFSQMPNIRFRFSKAVPADLFQSWPAKLGLLLLLAICTKSLCAEPLRWKFAEGDRFSLVFDQTQTQSTDVNGKKISVEIHLEMNMHWLIKSVDGDTATMRQSFESLKFDWRSSEGKEVNFDSKLQDKQEGLARQIAKTLLPVLECQFDVVMNTRGEILEVEANEETMEILRELPDSMALRRLFTKKGISATLSQAALVLPEADLAQGETWESKYETDSSAGKANATVTYTIGELHENSLQDIDLQGKIKFDQLVDDEAKSPQKVVAHEQVGQLVFDRDQGNLVSSQVKQTITTELPYREMTLRAGTASELKVTVKRERD